MKFNKKLLSIILCISLMFTLGGYLVSAQEVDNDEPRIVKIIVVENGTAYELEGQAAQDYLKNEEEKLIQTEAKLAELARTSALMKSAPSPTNATLNNIWIGPTYSYKFEETSRTDNVLVQYWKKRITEEYVNNSSVNQNVTLSYSVTQGADIEASLSAAYKDYLTSTLKASGHYSSSASGTYSMTIAPHKKMWISFTPRMNYVYGNLYTITRYNIFWSVTSEPTFTHFKETSTIYNSILRKNVPDGVYTFEEANA